MKTTIFKPKYKVSHFVSLVMSVLLEIYLLYGIIFCHNRDGGIIFFAIFWWFVIAGFLFLHVKRITLNDQSLTIEKYLLPAKTIAYKDIVTVDDEFIRARKGIVSLNWVVNVEVFHRLLKKHLRPWKAYVNFIVMNKMRKKRK